MNRPKDTERVVDSHLSQWFVRTVTRLVATYALVVGIAIYFGGPQRFAGLSYRVAIETPGAPWSWGISIFVAGVALLVGSIFGKTRVIGLGAVLGCVWALLFAYAFGRAAWLYDEANTTAQWAYLTLSILFGLIAGAHLAMQPIRAPWRWHRKAPKS